MLNVSELSSKMEELFGPPPILSWEDKNAYYHMMWQFWEQLDPQRFIQMLLVRDMTNATWNDTRLARYRVYAVERRVQRVQRRADRIAAIGKRRQDLAVEAKELNAEVQAGEINADEARALSLESVFEGAADDVKESLDRETDDRNGARALEVCVNHVGWLTEQQATERQMRNAAFQLYEYFEDRCDAAPTSPPPIIEGEGKHVEDVPPLVPTSASDKD